MSSANSHATRRIKEDSLWMLTIAPGIWGAHLMLSYITAAVWCAKFAGPNGSLASIRMAIAWYTVIALIGIAFIAWEGFRRHSFGSDGAETSTHDLDSPEDRHRFLGFATLLLAGLSGVATVYVAFAALVFDTCQ